MVLIKVPVAGLDTPLHQPAAIGETTLGLGHSSSTSCSVL
jgi:hypothetical protein